MYYIFVVGNAIETRKMRVTRPDRNFGLNDRREVDPATREVSAAELLRSLPIGQPVMAFESEIAARLWVKRLKATPGNGLNDFGIFAVEESACRYDPANALEIVPRKPLSKYRFSAIITDQRSVIAGRINDQNPCLFVRVDQLVDQQLLDLWFEYRGDPIIPTAAQLALATPASANTQWYRRLVVELAVVLQCQNGFVDPLFQLVVYYASPLTVSAEHFATLMAEIAKLPVPTDTAAGTTAVASTATAAVTGTTATTGTIAGIDQKIPVATMAMIPIASASSGTLPAEFADAKSNATAASPKIFATATTATATSAAANTASGVVPADLKISSLVLLISRDNPLFCRAPKIVTPHPSGVTLVDATLEMKKLLAEPPKPESPNWNCTIA